MDKLDAAIADMKYLINNTDNVCLLCKHNTKCGPEICPAYISGTGCYDVTTGKVDEGWEWDCRDFNFGDCPALENTPCHDCITGDGYTHWEWRGLHE